QYFPSLDYLIEVLDQACATLRPGGAIFLGDVRSLPLLDLFHTSVELARAPAARTAAQLRRRIRHAIARENELVIDPRFFRTLGRGGARIGSLVCDAVLTKRGRHHMELTQVRYDAILRRSDLA